jgi:hypothetical protein
LNSSEKIVFEPVLTDQATLRFGRLIGKNEKMLKFYAPNLDNYGALACPGRAGANKLLLANALTAVVAGRRLNEWWSALRKAW